jgi:hypothetical protein
MEAMLQTFFSAMMIILALALMIIVFGVGAEVKKRLLNRKAR